MIIRRSGEGASAAQIAETVVNIWGDIERDLAPIIGIRGVTALFSRSVYLVSREHAWLDAITPHGPISKLDFQSLRACVSSQPEDLALSGSAALIDQFQDLLSSMVGPALAERLLRTVSAPTPSGPPAQQDTTP